jgi:nucleoside-diphosphate-sugar epimerase
MTVETEMTRRIAVAGYGAVGRALVSLLSARGDLVRIVQRQEPGGLSPDVTFHRANLRDEREAQAAAADVETVVCTVGVPYEPRVWPVLMRNLLGACAKSGARFSSPTISTCSELKEMRFQWDRPYLVDTTKFARRFWNDPTPFETGLRATIAFYRNNAEI